MSKKRQSTSAWKKRQARIKSKRLRRSQPKRRYTLPANRSVPRSLREDGNRNPRPPRLFEIIAPEQFSIVSDPEPVLSFVLKVRSFGRTHHLFLNFAGVKKITADSVAVLIATIRGEDLLNVHIEGNVPEDSSAKEMLVESGFFEHVRKRVELPKGHLGRISQRVSKRVEPLVAQALIQQGTREAFGHAQVSQAAYGTLIDCMNNTFNHAARAMANPRKKYREMWWATVYADAERRRVCFTFLDSGVGIFRSLKLRGMRRAYHAVGIYSDLKILKDMLLGKVPSTTGLSYRGKGLPSIYRAFQRGDICSLVVIANDVYANVGTDDFQELAISFPGTLIYWEIEDRNEFSFINSQQLCSDTGTAA